MSYEKVMQAKETIIGTKQTVKAIRAGIVMEVIFAHDADNRIIAPAIEAAEQHSIKISYVDSREKLGEACGIEVGTAVVAITG